MVSWLKKKMDSSCIRSNSISLAKFCHSCSCGRWLSVLTYFRDNIQSPEPANPTSGIVLENSDYGKMSNGLYTTLPYLLLEKYLPGAQSLFIPECMSKPIWLKIQGSQKPYDWKYREVQTHIIENTGK